MSSTLHNTFTTAPKTMLVAGARASIVHLGYLERLPDSLQIDGDKIRRDLNWAPPYPLRQGLQVTAEWYRTRHT